jgi:hypothetical protein
MLRFLLRLPWLACGIFVLVGGLIFSLPEEHFFLGFSFMFLISFGHLVLLVRVGLIAFMTARFFLMLPEMFPLTLDFSTWYADATVLPLLVAAALAIYGFQNSLAGRPLLRDELAQAPAAGKS